MALVDEESPLGSRSELALFDVPPTQVAVVRGFVEEVQLANTCTSDGPWEFRIPPDVNMLDLRHNYVHLQLKIVRNDAGGGAAPAAGAAGGGADPNIAGPINLLGKTFFRNVAVYVSQRRVYDSNNLYAYRAFLETELNHGNDAKLSHLQAAGYQEDQPYDLIDSHGNLGFVVRTMPYLNGATVELIAPIHCDLFMQGKYLIPKADIRVELTRNSDAFCLMSFGANPRYSIKVESMKWCIRKIEVTPSLSLAIENALLAHKNAKYPLRRVELVSLHIDAGRRTTPINAILSGQLPRRMLVTLVDSDAFHGNFAKSPFNFKHFDLTEAKVTAGGRSYPNIPFRVDFEKGHFVELFHNLFEVLNLNDDSRAVSLTKEKFARGSTVLAFDLSPCCEDGGHFELVQSGTTSLHLTFSKPIPGNGAEAIIYAEYDNCISIDANRVPSFDFGH